MAGFSLERVSDLIEGMDAKDVALMLEEWRECQDCPISCPNCKTDCSAHILEYITQEEE